MKKLKSETSKTILFWVVLVVIILFIYTSLNPTRETQVTYPELKRKIANGEVASLKIFEDHIKGQLREKNQPFKTTFNVELLPSLEKTLEEYNQKAAPDKILDYEFGHPPSWWPGLLSFLPIVIIFALWFFFLRQLQGGGAKALSFGKSRHRMYTEHSDKVTFNDVAGAEEAKEDLQEIVEFLCDPHKFQRLGGKIPKGVLLCGPPGTGKTLLARAVAGEANVPFFSISGSDFVEMFVGVGASRVRDLFEQGKKNKPCIIFIDEIDAVGRQRFAGLGGGHDEREQTLNQLLVEMDGFDPNTGIILIAATNRPDVLDPALLRPGRFDRQVVLDTPDIKDREAIFNLHMKNVLISEDVKSNIFAQRTPGFSGADIANVCNEAALLAGRRSKDKVEMDDFEEAIERVMAGPQRRGRVMNEKEKKVIAYHESGHALLTILTGHGEELHKVSIMPRGTTALGYTLQVPIEDRYLTSRTELLSRMIAALGGRVAEELIFKDVTTGAHNDLQKVTAVAHNMICEFGMSEALGPISLGHRDKQVFLGRDLVKEKDYSDAIAYEIDKETRRIIEDCYQKAKQLLQKNIDKLNKLAETLLEKEVINAKEVKSILEQPEANSSEEKKDSITEIDKSAAVAEMGDLENSTPDTEQKNEGVKE